MPKTRRTRDSAGAPISAVTFRGFWRVNLVEHDEHGTPKVVGDSGWSPNQIVLAGLQNLANLLPGTAGSSIIRRGALGTGTVPSSNTTSIPGEFGDATGASSTANRAQATIATAQTGGNSYNVSFLFTWLSAQSFNQAARTIQNIGLYPDSNTGGTLFSGATFATSQLSTNQDVQATYVIRMGT